MAGKTQGPPFSVRHCEDQKLAGREKGEREKKSSNRRNSGGLPAINQKKGEGRGHMRGLQRPQSSKKGQGKKGEKALTLYGKTKSLREDRRGMGIPASSNESLTEKNGGGGRGRVQNLGGSRGSWRVMSTLTI